MLPLLAAIVGGLVLLALLSRLPGRGARFGYRAGKFVRRHRGGALRVFSVPYYFCLVNAAAFLGVLSIARGARVREWSPRGT